MVEKQNSALYEYERPAISTAVVDLFNNVVGRSFFAKRLSSANFTFVIRKRALSTYVEDLHKQPDSICKVQDELPRASGKVRRAF